MLLSDARSVLAGVDEMRARAKGISSGIEAELSVVIDVMFPIAPITDAAKAFREKFPGTPLRIYVEVLGGAYEPLLDLRASLGVVGPLPEIPPSLTLERLPGIPMVMVAAPDHPLAADKGTIPSPELERHIRTRAHRPIVAFGRQGLLCGFALYLAPCSSLREARFPP